MTHGTRQRARTCPYIRRGPDSGEKKGVFVGNHGNFQKRRKKTTKGARLEGRESEPAAQVGKRLFQAPSDRGETPGEQSGGCGPHGSHRDPEGPPRGDSGNADGGRGTEDGSDAVCVLPAWTALCTRIEVPEEAALEPHLQNE